MNIASRVSALLALAALAFSQAALAVNSNARPDSDSIKLPAIFSDNMVLQQQQEVPIWGWSAPRAAVTVKFGGESKSTHANAQGIWRVKLGELTASFTPQSLVVESGGETKVFTNILVGEVWICSGQSNMEKPIGDQPGQKPCLNAQQELAAANYPGIRIFKVEKALAAAPLDDFKQVQTWRLCDSNALATIRFSAAGYFFGREIHTNLNVPVGLIDSTWGGTRSEPWTPKQGFESVHSLAKLAIPVAKSTKIHSTTPMGIYNAMIAPMAGFAIRGALWYQGESNCAGTGDDNAYLTYADKMAALIGGWRMNWGEGNFPFYFVQIAPYRYFGRDKNVPSAERLPEFWAVQSRAEHTIKNTGMVVTTDLVDDLDDIHPRDKQDVGHRLALLARNKTYGEKDVVASGPVFKQMKIEGNKAILTFDNVDGGLMSRDGQPLTWFGIAGSDGKFVDGDAVVFTDLTGVPLETLDNAKASNSADFWNARGRLVGDRLEVSSPDVEKPVAVRFAWRESAQPNFCNKSGLPAEPFSTENPAGQ